MSNATLLILTLDLMSHHDHWKQHKVISTPADLKILDDFQSSAKMNADTDNVLNNPCELLNHVPGTRLAAISTCSLLLEHTKHKQPVESLNNLHDLLTPTPPAGEDHDYLQPRPKVKARMDIVLTNTSMCFSYAMGGHHTPPWSSTSPASSARAQRLLYVHLAASRNNLHDLLPLALLVDEGTDRDLPVTDGPVSI